MKECSVEHGMGAMCRYSYLSGACANKHVDSLECVGVDKCEFHTLNVLTKARPGKAADCQHGSWLGLYCEKYGKFFCAGEENCSTPESYHEHLSNYQQNLKRLAPAKEP
jgi:hypothetical protein